MAATHTDIEDFEMVAAQQNEMALSSKQQQQATANSSEIGSALAQVVVDTGNSSDSHSLALRSLTTVLTSMQRKQEVFNRSMSRANAMNLFIGVQNHSRNTRLAKQQGQLRQRIEQGEALVRSMEMEIDSQRHTVATIGSDVEVQQSSIRELEGNLDTQRQQLAQLADQYGRELAAQHEMIASQNRTLQSLQTTKFKHDAVIDSIILLISLATVNTPVVDWPVRLLSYTTSFFSTVNANSGGGRLPGHQRRAALVSRLLRLASFFAVARALRVYAIKKGVHNYVGGSAAYLDIVRSAIVTPSSFSSSQLEGDVHHQSGPQPKAES